MLSVSEHWEQDLTQVSGLVEQVAADLDAILTKGMRDAVKPLLLIIDTRLGRVVQNLY